MNLQRRLFIDPVRACNEAQYNCILVEGEPWQEGVGGPLVVVVPPLPLPVYRTGNQYIIWANM